MLPMDAVEGWKRPRCTGVQGKALALAKDSLVYGNEGYVQKEGMGKSAVHRRGFEEGEGV